MPWITIVLSPTQHANIKKAAAEALKDTSTGVRPGVSTWARPILVKAAEAELAEAKQIKSAKKAKR